MEQEYIKGDIVMYNNKIHTIMNTLGVNNYELSYISHPVSQLELSGVPLTPEILEKNGWVLYHIFYRFISKECLKLRLLKFNNYSWDACIGGNVIRINIRSVSDLQHLFFGLGLNSEMEV